LNGEVESESNNRIEDSGWRSLFRVGGLAALVAAILILTEIMVFIVWPLPSTISEYFMLFQNNRFIGLIDFYLLEFIAFVLFIPIFLAFYISLRRANEGLMFLAIILAMVGITIFLSTNNPFSMLSLSDQYATATTNMQKSQLVAAAQAILTNTNQRAIGGFNMGFLLISITGLIVSCIMLHSKSFSKATAYLGILTFTISLVDYFRIIIFPSLEILLIIIAITSGLTLLIWLAFICKNLLQLIKNR